MSKYTTTIYEILAGEAHREGFSDFLAPDGLHVIGYGDDLAFTSKVASYDADVKKWADRVIFGRCALASPGADYFFKKAFVQRFINREIAFQTVDLWRIKLVGEMTRYGQWISNTYDSFDKIYVGEKDGKTTGNLAANHSDASTIDFTGNVNSTGKSQTDTNSTSRQRDLDATLPQNETSLSLDSDDVSYADSRKDTKQKSTGGTTQTTNSETDTKNDTVSKATQDIKQDTTGTSYGIGYDITTTEKILRVYDPVFTELDKQLFLQIW